MSEHMPSPWRLEEPEDGGRVIACDDRATIVHEPSCSPFNEQARADARLIAAAPDLLAALTDVLFEDSDKSEEAIIITRIKAMAAIAKATGA